jgi:8-oxo-dGTP pyrophosphatase MutT (NUDIX family)
LEVSPDTLLDKIKRRLFWVIARTCFIGYHYFPIFGPLRASLAVIRKSDRFLVMERADGRGYSFPGGIARRGEPEEETLRREVREETGLNVDAMELKLSFFSNWDIPCNQSVYLVEARGEVRNSWEGSFHWLTLQEIEPKLVRSQRPIFLMLSGSSSGTDDRHLRSSGP